MVDVIGNQVGDAYQLAADLGSGGTATIRPADDTIEYVLGSLCIYVNGASATLSFNLTDGAALFAKLPYTVVNLGTNSNLYIVSRPIVVTNTLFISITTATAVASTVSATGFLSKAP